MTRLFSIAYRFSRPHTILGSVLSTAALYFMAAYPAGFVRDELPLFWITLAAALGCNLYIVGLNQIVDIELDKKNKPHLPLASGELSVSAAKLIVGFSALIALVTAFLAGELMLLLVVVVSLLGTAYSLPPLKFKKHHFGAAISITLVRGALVNVLMFLHFNNELVGSLDFPEYMWPLVLFMILFSIGIAWLKDIPDISGDRVHFIKTLAVYRGARWAFRGAVSLVALTYLIMILWGGIGVSDYSNVLLTSFHFGMLVLFLTAASLTNPYRHTQVKLFYRFYWLLFFAEYLVYPIGLVL